MQGMQMEVLIPLLGIFFGGLTLLVPVVGITARIALKPMMDAFARYREVRGDVEMVHLLERRVALMEEQLHNIERSVGQLVEDSEFRRQLESGEPRLQPPAA
ncbi:MAG TPA: hypothetical protein VFX98_05595 [Longimicrobiaceae bacterium]|nr:hypothetical protein [Longimicrobiaceae bacterium]